MYSTMSMAAKRVCKDCGGGTRPAPHPGPRCATHHRARRAGIKEAAWSRRLADTYNITPEMYWEIYKAQGGVCALCRRAKGTAKRLAVDHDHSCCPAGSSCGRCVRSLCCGPCNKLLGHMRDDPEMAERILLYLVEPPGKEIISSWSAR